MERSRKTDGLVNGSERTLLIQKNPAAKQRERAMRAQTGKVKILMNIPGEGALKTGHLDIRYLGLEFSGKA